jgi:glycosyltransferase 2 family protein
LKANFKKIISIILPLFIGLGIMYYQYDTMSQVQVEKTKLTFLKADYFYIFLSLVISIIGYWSRSYRWKFALNHLGYTTKFRNDFFTVSVSYLVNLTIPRSGEITRAIVLKKYENIPFDKGFGTIVAERVVDSLIFLFLLCIGFVLQFDKIYQFLLDNHFNFNKIIYVAITGFLLFIVFILIWKFSKLNIVLKLKNKFSGLSEGILSIYKMEKKWAYIFHSFLIWFSYIAMFYITIFALPETESIGFDVVIMGFIFGTFAIGFSPGGLGAYPYAIASVFFLYGIPKEIGTAFGYLVWTSQTLLTIVLGILSYILLPILNKK